MLKTLVGNFERFLKPVPADVASVVTGATDRLNEAITDFERYTFAFASHGTDRRL
jgi:hypothetical protein